MKLTAALKATWHTYRTQFPSMMLTLLIQLILRVMALTPLLFLALEETKMLVLLCIPLYILIVLPARQNMAQCMQDALNGGSIFSVKMLSVRGYGRKVLRGIQQTLLMAAWGVAFIACTALAVFVYSAPPIEGVTDVFTLLRTLMTLGGGSSIKGAKVVMVIYAATLLPLMLGVAFHSGTRHAWALGGRKILRGHHLHVIGTWLIGCLALLPFMAAVATIGSGFLSAVANALGNLGKGSISLPSLHENLYALLAAAVVLLCPAIPFKQLLSAAYVRELSK